MVSRLSPLLFALLTALLGLASFAAPEEILARFAQLDGDISDRTWIMWGFGAACFSIALATLGETYEFTQKIKIELIIMSFLTACLVFFTMQLSNWWIDDAGITFSYSRTLSEGYGVTFQPGETPTEGYSSSLWMLLLAFAGVIGFDIPVTAKFVGIACGIATLLFSSYIVWRQTHNAISLAFSGIAISTAPFVVWISSGQEHAMQGLLLLLIAIVVGFEVSRWRLKAAVLLSLLVLTRPEAPLIVMATYANLMLWSWYKDQNFDILKHLEIALVPFLIFVVLLVWRVIYFGDLLPNPYYAKASGSDFFGALNPFGAGWSYILNGLQASGLMLAVPLFVFAFAVAFNRLLLAFLAVLGAHIMFILWAGGDWMGQFRFLMPVIPMIAVLAALGISKIPFPETRLWCSAICAFIIVTSTVKQVDRFEARPTTPLAVVSEIGSEFARVSDMLDISDPLLAHHDAGGIAYDREIRLLDLGGLVDRDVAKNMTNRAFLENYIFVERQPHFIFGAINFAARSGFTESDAFFRDYVPLIFENRPIMNSTLSHIRRDHVIEVEGLIVERAEDSAIVSVTVLNPVESLRN